MSSNSLSRNKQRVIREKYQLTEQQVAVFSTELEQLNTQQQSAKSTGATIKVRHSDFASLSKKT